MSQLKYWNGSAWVTAVVGASGPTGPTGTSATIAVGTVTTTGPTGTPSVTNAGTSQAATFNFVLQQGPTGPAAWPSYTFSTATTAGSQGAGSLNYNNATVSSVTAIYFDDTDANSVDRTAWMTAWGTPSSTVKGYLTIKNTATTTSDPVIFAVTSVTNNSSYYTIGVTYVSGSATPPANATTLTVDFARTGDTGGATGPTGPTGATSGGVGSLVTTPSITTLTETVLTSGTLAANSIVAGSTYRFAASGLRTGASSGGITIRLRIGPTTLTGSISATWAQGATTTASAWYIDGIVTVRTSGAAGTTLGQISSIYGTTAGLGQNATTVAVDTTVSNLMELTLQQTGTANTQAVYNAYIQQVK